MDINQASREQLQRAFQVDSERAEHVLRKRDELGGFRDWNQFKELVPGFGEQMVNNLQEAGFTLGTKEADASSSGQSNRQEEGSVRDACDLLDIDHRRIEGLFEDFRRSGADQATKANLAQIICMELKVHTMLEEEIFYPAVRRATADERLMQQAQKEHDQAADLMERVEAGGDIDQLIPTLQRAIEEHVQEEREQIFPKARGASDLDLESMVARIESRRVELIDRSQEEA